MRGRFAVVAGVAVGLLAGLSGCSSGGSPTASPGSAAVTSPSMSVSPAPSPPPTMAAPVDASSECTTLATGWSDYQAMYAAAGPTDFHGRETAALDFAKSVTGFFDVDPRTHQLGADLNALDSALLRDQEAYLGLGDLSTASTAPGVASAVAVVAKDEQAFAASCTAPSSAAASPGPSVPVSDNPTFDLTGSGSDCTMTYGPSPSGGTLTVVTVDEPGEIITHVSDGSGGIHRNDTHITQGPNAFSYDVPLGSVGDMGAVFYPDGAPSQSCTIKAAQ